MTLAQHVLEASVVVFVDDVELHAFLHLPVAGQTLHLVRHLGGDHLQLGIFGLDGFVETGVALGVAATAVEEVLVAHLHIVQGEGLGMAVGHTACAPFGGSVADDVFDFVQGLLNEAVESLACHVVTAEHVAGEDAEDGLRTHLLTPAEELQQTHAVGRPIAPTALMSGSLLHGAQCALPPVALAEAVTFQIVAAGETQKLGMHVAQHVHEVGAVEVALDGHLLLAHGGEGDVAQTAASGVNVVQEELCVLRGLHRRCGAQREVIPGLLTARLDEVLSKHASVFGGAQPYADDGVARSLHLAAIDGLWTHGNTPVSGVGPCDCGVVPYPVLGPVVVLRPSAATAVEARLAHLRIADELAVKTTFVAVVDFFGHQTVERGAHGALHLVGIYGELHLCRRRHRSETQEER